MEKSTSQRTSRSSTKATKEDAVALLVSDHKAVKKLFKEYEKLAESDKPALEEKAKLVQSICNELLVHTQIEEEIFYPAVREALGEDDMVDEALVEHDSAKYLIQQLQKGKPGDEMYDAKVQVLGEYIDHHVKEEEEEMFAQAKKAKLDMDALGAELLEKKQQLMKKMVH